MAFLKSLFAGVSALRNHQTMMDVIGNNIANVNTTGFKAARATFSELYAQTLRGASRPTINNGGTNAMQVGLGVAVSSLDTMFAQGSIEQTNGMYDLAIFGQGFFVVNQGGQTVYTRAGNFTADADGSIVMAGTGARLQGKMADINGVIPSGTTLTDIVINKDIKSPARATTFIEYSGNLDSSAGVYSPGPPPTGGTTKGSASIYDSLGNRIAVTLTFTKTGTNAWNWTATVPDPAPATTSTTVGSGSLTFNTDGTLHTVTGNTISITPANGGSPQSIELRFGTPSAAAPGVFAGVTQTEGSSTVTPRSYDGYRSGTLKDVKFDSSGKILGTFSNETVQTLAQVMLAEFDNVNGLMRLGDSLFSLSGNSGTPAIVEPGESSTLAPGSLEQSNVDLADEFTKMITAQRGFQASARVISTSDEFLQEVVNLKR